MLASQLSGAPSDDPAQTESECQGACDYDDPPPGGLGGAGPPGQLYGGFDISSFDPDWLLASNMVGQSANQSSFGAPQTPSRNLRFNSSIPSHTIAQQHQWDAGNHFPPSNPSLDNFRSPNLFDLTGFSNPASLTGLGQQNQSLGATGNNQSNVPLSGTQMACGGHSVTSQQFRTHGLPFQSPIPSQNEPQATRDPQATPFHPRPEHVVNGIRTSPTSNQRAPGNASLANSGLHFPASAPVELNLGQVQGNVPMPDWIALVKPSLQAGRNVITLRRDTHVALDIILERLPRQPHGGYNGIKIPATASVRNYAETAGKALLEFRIHVYGTTSNRRYETVCAGCEKREGMKNGTPSLIDFIAAQDIIEQKDGKVRAEFIFCCYPKCHQNSGYFLDIVLSEDVAQNNIVAQYRLPFSFNVVPRLPQGQKRTRRQMEESEEVPPVVDQRNVRPRFDDSSQRDAADERNDHPMPAPAINPWDAPQGSQYREGDSSSAPPPAIPHSQLPQNAGSNSGPLNAWKPPNSAIPPPRIDGEPTPTLTEVNPKSGSITGGARIWLKGMEFPAFPLFARFGTVVVPTSFSASILLGCDLPPATTPGVVDVTLSRQPQPNAPEYGTSIAKFHYLADHDQLIPILLRIQGQGYPELSPVLQALLTTLNGSQQNRGLQGGSHGAGPREDPIETGLIEALSCLQERPNFHEIVSTTNDYNQTLAHLSILYDYPSLLGRLVEWHIKLSIADVNGLTALHCAYMKGDLDSVRSLRRGGASETVMDKLGRTPSELLPEGLEGFESDTDVDAEPAAGLDAEVYVLGAQNREQPAALQQLDVRINHEPIGHTQATPVPAPQASLPLTTTLIETNPDNSAIALPSWLSLVRPEPKDRIVLVRRECQVILDIKFKELPALPGQRPVTWKGLVIPSTANVRTEEHHDEGDVVHFSVRVFGADTKSEYKSVCDACSKREGKRKGMPSLVDFHAASNVIKASDDGLVQVKFKFSCYPKHQNPNESAYSLEVALLEKQHQGQLVPSQRVVATCRLPLYFKVGKLQGGQSAPAATAGGTVPSQNRASSPSGQRPMTGDTLTPRPCAGPEPRVPTLESMIPPPPGLSSLSEADPDDEDSRDATWERGVRSGLEKMSEASCISTAGSSGSPSRTPSWNPPLRSRRSNRFAQPVESCNTVVMTTNPRSGPVSGGIEIWLDGEELTRPFALYARFGTQVVETTVQNEKTLACILPSASHAGRVRVTLSRSPYPGAAEYGTSIAEFVYHSNDTQLIPILLRMEEEGRPEYAPSIQALLTVLQGDRAPQGSANSQAEQIESSLLWGLLSLREKPNFDDIISTSNDSNQTLAHLSVLYGYISLLRHLVEWRIDLRVADISGLTALHCAYLKEDRESIRILLRGGAPPSIEDKLGRLPRDLAPEGSDLADWLEGEIGTGVGSHPIEHPMDEEIALGEQFTAFEAEEHGNDSDHGGSGSESDTSSNNGEDEEGMDIGSPTVEPGPPTSKLSRLEAMNSRNKYGPRLIPDTPHEAAVSTVAKKLQDTEAEPAAIEFLCNGVFPDGTITLEALKVPITAQSVSAQAPIICTQSILCM